MSQQKNTGPVKESDRERGRPRKGKAPFVSWQEVDRLLVFGEKVADEASGHEDIRYPSFREVAKRFSVSKSLIGQYAAKHNCMKRREENQAREQIQFEQELVKKRAKARALSTEDELRIIDDYIRGFEKAVEEGRVRYDNPADFNTMVRLKEFKLGRADSRQEVHGMISLEEIQARHKALQVRLYGHDPALAGRRGDDNKPVNNDEAPESPRDDTMADETEGGVAQTKEAEDSGTNEQSTSGVVSFRDEPFLSTEERVRTFGKQGIRDQFDSLPLEDFQQEFEVTFVDESYSFYPYDLILPCTSDDLVVHDDFTDFGEIEGRLVAGFDVGRKRDLSELAIVEELAGKKHCRLLRTYDRVPFSEQEADLRRMLDILPVMRLSIDQSGIGMHLAENLSRDYPQVVPEAFTNEHKEVWATDFKILLQRMDVELPKDRELVAQIHSIKKRLTPSGKPQFDAEYTGRGHSDRFWALALACQKERVPGPDDVLEIGARVVG